MSTIIDPVRGMRDVLPADLAPQQAIAARLEQTLASYGYQAIELPIIEQRDLYGRKLGEELVGKVYEFSFNGRELALRPEWTASVLRAYVGRMQGLPLPLRLRYAGPVFRNERPQRATYRQFTQVGVELIGGPAPRADAECIALACAGLDATGVSGYQVRVGHIGLVRQILRRLGLAERTQGLLAWSLERMRQHGVAAVRDRLDMAHSELPFDAALLEGLDDAQAEALLLGSLAAIGVNLQFGTRSPEAIVRRLVRKLRREDPQPKVERALDLLARLCAIQGPPAAAFAAAEELLAAFDLPTSMLDELRALIHVTAAHDLAEERMVLDFGLGRGLERVVAAGAPQTVAAPPEVLVVAAEDLTYGYALRVAQALRERGWVAIVDVRGRSAANNQRDGARRGAAAVVAVGPDEQARQEVIWRDLAERAERRIALAELPRV